MAVIGINKKPYFDLESYLDMAAFEKLQPEILTGFAEAREYAKEGTWMKPGFTWDDASYIINWKPIPVAIEEFLKLPDDDPIKIAGMAYYKDFKNYQQRNKFTRFLKMAMGAYDPYIYYFLWEEGDWKERPKERQLTEESKYFPGVVDWVLDLKNKNIFEHIGRVVFFHCEAGGIPFEHRDLDAQYGINKTFPHRNEFIHVRPNTKKAFYVWDPENKNKIYINSRAAWWNDQDWHGGEMIMEPSYALRIDGKFTDEFRNTLGISHLETY